MGLIEKVLSMVFGGGNLIRDTAGVFRENAEAGAQRDHDRATAALAQFGAEFTGRRSWFDALVDGVNRLPRPMMALGTIGLFVAAMTDPAWFAGRMQGLALVPEALWWLMGAIVSFYFGARHQLKGQQFQRELASSIARMPAVTDSVMPSAPQGSPEEPGPGSGTATAALATGANAALDEWRQVARA